MLLENLHGRVERALRGFKRLDGILERLLHHCGAAFCHLDAALVHANTQRNRLPVRIARMLAPQRSQERQGIIRPGLRQRLIHRSELVLKAGP